MAKSEGTLQLKQDSGGNLHYIKTAKGKHIDLRCGTGIEIQPGKYVEHSGDDVLEPDQWLSGRYEAYLGSEPEAYFYLRLYPGGDAVKMTLPLGTTVRVK